MLDVRHLSGQEAKLLYDEYTSAAGGAKVYPTHYKKGEEIHFPLRGEDHLIFVVDGLLDVQERNVMKQMKVSPAEAVRLTRSQNKEYLDVKTVALQDSNVVWIVVHFQ